VTARGAALILAAGTAFAAACDDTGASVPASGGADAGAQEAGAAALAAVDPSVIERGEYLVRNVAGCGECHTPRDAQGNLDMSGWLAGVADRFDVAPDDDSVGAISAPNLTPYHLSSWSDDDIEHAMRDGVSVDGTPLYPVMPYYAFHNMSDDDATAVVTYLRAVTPIANDTPPRQPLPAAFDAPAPPIPESAIPHTTLAPSDPAYASAEHGRYLAGEIGFCLDCHTPWRLGITPPLDLTRVFGGHRAFSAKEWSVPPPAPPVIYSYDITPDPTGIGGWSPENVVIALQHGMGEHTAGLCRPMPSGPTGGFGGMLAQDARDIGTYLTTIPPIPGGDDIPKCTTGGDGGVTP
jgi:mono/diheme cytochrome c family protein